LMHKLEKKQICTYRNAVERESDVSRDSPKSTL
jgi:hypothetical protein